MFHLGVMVKNEANKIADNLRRYLPIIAHWTVLDTGSTDTTIQEVRRALSGIPGAVVESSWRGFSKSRNCLFDAMKKADCTLPYLLVDADMVPVIAKEGITLPNAPCGMVKIVIGTITYRLPQILQPGYPWRYQGVAHNYLTCEIPIARGNVQGLELHPVRPKGESRVHKIQQDLRALEPDISSPRSCFYTAQSYKDLGHLQEAARYYKMRAAQTSDFEEEGWYAHYMWGVLETDLASKVSILLEAFNRRPWRAEPLVALSRALRDRKQHTAALIFADHASKLPYPDQEVLFVHHDVYRWEALLELQVCQQHVGNRPEAVRVAERLLNMPDLPGNARSAVLRNLSLL